MSNNTNQPTPTPETTPQAQPEEVKKPTDTPPEAPKETPKAAKKRVKKDKKVPKEPKAEKKTAKKAPKEPKAPKAKRAYKSRVKRVARFSGVMTLKFSKKNPSISFKTGQPILSARKARRFATWLVNEAPKYIEDWASRLPGRVSTLPGTVRKPRKAGKKTAKAKK